MKRAPFLCKKVYAFPLYFLNWMMHLSQFKPPWQRDPIGKVIWLGQSSSTCWSRARCSKWINKIGLNLLLDFKNTVYVPYALVRTRLYCSKKIWSWNWISQFLWPWWQICGKCFLLYNSCTIRSFQFYEYVAFYAWLSATLRKWGRYARAVYKIPRIFKFVRPSNFRTQDSYNRIKQKTNFRTRPSFVR